MELNVYSKFYFYSDDGLYKLFSTCISNGNIILGHEIINELKKRSENVEYTMSKEMQINTIISVMDFYKIHEVMKLINWKWYDYPNGYIIPSIEKLKEKVKILLSEIWDNTEGCPHSFRSTGGFKVECLINDGQKYLNAHFELTEFDIDYDTLRCRDMYEIPV